MARGTGELTRILRELYDAHNRMQRQTGHRTVVFIKTFPEEPEMGDFVVFDNTQPSTTPKWGVVTHWSRSNNNVLWSEGAKWQTGGAGFDAGFDEGFE